MANTRLGWQQLETWATGSLGLSAILVASWATAARYFLPAWAPDWSDEVVVYLCVWALWLSAGRLARDNTHVRAEVLTHWLTPRARMIAEAFHCVIGLIFCAAMVYAGLEVVRLSVLTGEHGDSTLRLPLAIFYAGLPVGSALMLAAYATRLRRGLHSGS